ncbi:MAG: isoprenyl transferase [Clostridiales bacterium]|nr:isoprenyl transferase [Clostridiales bacterium]
MENNIILPRHVAVIMDGNGRWAKKRGLPRTFGHKVGTENVRKIVKYCSKKGIQYLTVYAFSTENFKRPEEEVGTLMKLLVEYFNKETEELRQNGVRLNVIGDISAFSPIVQKAINDGIKKTKDCKDLVFTIALAYGARAELVRAVKMICNDNVKDITEETISKYLYTFDMPDPDLIIRTSGEQRLSNYLLYQAAYSEFYFTDCLWPDFDEREFDKALEEYSKRNRRFGGV